MKSSSPARTVTAKSSTQKPLSQVVKDCDAIANQVLERNRGSIPGQTEQTPRRLSAPLERLDQFVKNGGDVWDGVLRVIVTLFTKDLESRPSVTTIPVLLHVRRDVLKQYRKWCKDDWGNTVEEAMTDLVTQLVDNEKTHSQLQRLGAAH